MVGRNKWAARFFIIAALIALGAFASRQLWNISDLDLMNRDRLSVLYLSWDEAGQIQLFKTQVDGKIKQLTAETAVILHYAPSPNGKLIAYTTGDTIWLMDENGRHLDAILACPNPPCDQLIWHPDNRRLLYEQKNQLWWLDTTAGETAPLQENSTGSSRSSSRSSSRGPSRAARFSADGQWVSFVVSPDAGIEFYNFADGRHFQIASVLGAPAIWHPTEPTFLYRDQRLVAFHGSNDDDHQGHSHDYALAEALYQASVAAPSGLLVSDDSLVDDASPAWSPDGEWIVFGRKPPRTAAGRQLWLARPDGSEAKALTDEPLIHHGLPQWSEDGRFILYQRYDTTDPTTPPGIWLLELETGQTKEIIAAGFQPAWLP